MINIFLDTAKRQDKENRGTFQCIGTAQGIYRISRSASCDQGIFAAESIRDGLA